MFLRPLFVSPSWPLTCNLVKWHLMQSSHPLSLHPLCSKAITRQLTISFNQPEIQPSRPLTLSPLHSSLSVSPLSDFHPPSWENRRESSWQRRWGERGRESWRKNEERGGFSDEEKSGLLSWKGTLFSSSTLLQLHLCDSAEPAASTLLCLFKSG